MDMAGSIRSYSHRCQPLPCNLWVRSIEELVLRLYRMECQMPLASCLILHGILCYLFATHAANQPIQSSFGLRLHQSVRLIDKRLVGRHVCSLLRSIPRSSNLVPSGSILLARLDQITSWVLSKQVLMGQNIWAHRRNYGWQLRGTQVDFSHKIDPSPIRSDQLYLISNQSQILELRSWYNSLCCKDFHKCLDWSYTARSHWLNIW